MMGSAKLLFFGAFSAEFRVFVDCDELFVNVLVYPSKAMPHRRNQYKPGVCNIGQKEVSVRWKFIRLFLPVTAFLSIGSFYWWDSLWVWFFLLCSTFSLLVLCWEVRTRFCIIFGFFSLHNFRHLGELEEVENPDDIRRDRKRVWEITLQAMAIALGYATSVHLLASYLGLHH